MNNPIAHALEQITLGDPVTFENITMIPLIGPASVEQEPFYLTIDQALADSTTEITEISEQGSVPELRVTNKGAQPVFILDGEELLGAKQNRVVNLSILVPANGTGTLAWKDDAPGVEDGPVVREVTFEGGEDLALGLGSVGVGLGRKHPGQGCFIPRGGKVG